MDRGVPQFLSTIALVAAVCPAFARDEAVDPKEKAAISASAKVLVEAAASAGLDRDSLVRFDKAAEAVSTSHLDHVGEAEELAKLGSDGERLAEQAVRALIFLRATRRNLSDAAGVSVRISSADPAEVCAAMTMILKEPFGKEFRQVVVLLSQDKRSEVRLAAGGLAKYATLLAGPDPGLRAVAENLLVDEDPRVAAAFARRDCMDFEDLVLMDRMVDRIEDMRLIPERAETRDGRFLVTGAKSVSAAIKSGLCAGVSRLTTFLAETSGPRGGDAASVAEFRAWWKELRKAGPPKPGAGRYSLVFSGTVTLQMNELTALEGSKVPLEVQLTELALIPDDWVPQSRMTLELHDKVNYLGLCMAVGNPKQRFAWIAGAGNNAYSVRALAAPLADGKARVRLWIWQSK